MPDLAKIFPLGEDAVTVDFGNVISPELNARAVSLAAHFEEHAFNGFLEAVPAYASTTIYFDPIVTLINSSGFATASDAVRDLILAALNDLSLRTTYGETVEIPVDFSREAALDIANISTYSGLSESELIDEFVSRTYRVYMIGFLPGFAYMGEVDERIAMPRRSSPRLKVPKGSVGIAGRQTGIYPVESPGGWQIIGRTDVEMFMPYAESPCFLKAGDQVKFVATAR